VVVKPAEVASASVVRLAPLFEEVGFPPGCFNVVTGYGRDAGDALVAHPDVRKVFFTGGVETAKLVARRAAEKVKPVALELGGKSANIVFADADIEVSSSGELNAGITPITPNGSRVTVAASDARSMGTWRPSRR